MLPYADSGTQSNSDGAVWQGAGSAGIAAGAARPRASLTPGRGRTILPGDHEKNHTLASGRPPGPVVRRGPVAGATGHEDQRRPASRQVVSLLPGGGPGFRRERGQQVRRLDARRRAPPPLRAGEESEGPRRQARGRRGEAGLPRELAGGPLRHDRAGARAVGCRPPRRRRGPGGPRRGRRNRRGRSVGDGPRAPRRERLRGRAHGRGRLRGDLRRCPPPRPGRFRHDRRRAPHRARLLRHGPARPGDRPALRPARGPDRQNAGPVQGAVQGGPEPGAQGGRAPEHRLLRRGQGPARPGLQAGPPAERPGREGAGQHRGPPGLRVPRAPALRVPPQPRADALRFRGLRPVRAPGPLHPERGVPKIFQGHDVVRPRRFQAARLRGRRHRRRPAAR
ncbi:MAG: hypothetical protein MZU84_08790 [Sphingobacterium sp.]|nr:hypothetical protein [Sphingobacterium sp.]